MDKVCIIDYCNFHTKISQRDYETKADFVRDVNARNYAKRKALELLNTWPDNANIVGKGYRFDIKSNDIDYIVGQYAPTEMWHNLVYLLTQLKVGSVTYE